MRKEGRKQGRNYCLQHRGLILRRSMYTSIRMRNAFSIFPPSGSQFSVCQSVSLSSLFSPPLRLNRVKYVTPFVLKRRRNDLADYSASPSFIPKERIVL